jgi:hypothetical protein
VQEATTRRLLNQLSLSGLCQGDRQSSLPSPEISSRTVVLITKSLARCSAPQALIGRTPSKSLDCPMTESNLINYLEQSRVLKAVKPQFAVTNGLCSCMLGMSMILRILGRVY